MKTREQIQERTTQHKKEMLAWYETVTDDISKTVLTHVNKVISEIKARINELEWVLPDEERVVESHNDF